MSAWRAKPPLKSRLVMVLVVSIGNSMVGGLTPGIGLPQHDIVGWTKTTALRRLISSNTGAKAGSPRSLPA